MSQVVIITFLTDSRRIVRYLGPYQISWYTKQQGYTSQVLDFVYFMTKEQRLDLYRKFITPETKIVGWAPFLMPGGGQKLDTGLQTALDTLNEIKENFPWVKIVVGGQVVKWFLKSGHKNFSFKVDAVFDGYAEYTFLEYCDYVFKKAQHPRFEIENSMKVIRPTKEYDIYACRMVFEKNDFIMPGESLPLELSRGCIFKCKFCQYPNIGKDKNDFNRSLHNVKDSLIYNYEMFGTTRYHLTDDTLNSHRERTKELLEITKQLPFKIEFIGYVRLDLLDIWPEQKDILPEAGLISCHFGVESLDPESCKQIGKGWGAKNHKTWLPYIKKYWGNDVIINCTLIAGLGKETEKEWKETDDWFRESGIDDWFYQPLSLHNSIMMSEFEKNAEQYGYRWPDPINNPSYWENDVTNLNRAKEWCLSVNTPEQFKEKVPSVWNFSAFRNLGLSKEQIRNSNYFDLSKIRNERKLVNQFIECYYKTAMEFETE